MAPVNGAPAVAGAQPGAAAANGAAALNAAGLAALNSAGPNNAGRNNAGLNNAGQNSAGAYAGGEVHYPAPQAPLGQRAQVGGLSPQGLNTGVPYQGGAGAARAMPAPIRPGDYADVLPPVQYAPPRVAAPAGRSPGPAPYSPGPYGAGGPGYPPAPGYGNGNDTAARPDAPRTADSASRVQAPPFMGLALIVAAIALAVLLPVAGLIGSVIVITLLRAADRASSALTIRRSARGPSVTDVFFGVLTAPWAIVRSVLTTVLIAPLAAGVAAVVFVAAMVATSPDSVLMASGYAAGAAVALYGLGPGSGGPRREVTRIVRAVARTRTTAIIAALIMYCLAAAMVAEALSQPPIYWPDLSGLLPHLPNLNTVLHLPHLNLPHFGVGRSRLGLGSPHAAGRLVLGGRPRRRYVSGDPGLVGRPDQAQRHHLVGQPDAPVEPAGDAELLVQPEQVLFDRRLGHDQVPGDLPGRRRGHERIVGQRGAAQRGQHVEFPPGQLRHGGTPQLGLGGQVLSWSGRRPGTGPRRRPARLRPQAPAGPPGGRSPGCRYVIIPGRRRRRTARAG